MFQIIKTLLYKRNQFQNEVSLYFLKLFLIHLHTKILFLWYNTGRWKIFSINTKELNVHNQPTTGQLSAHYF